MTSCEICKKSMTDCEIINSIVKDRPINMCLDCGRFIQFALQGGTTEIAYRKAYDIAVFHDCDRNIVEAIEENAEKNGIVLNPYKEEFEK